jgi:preprotein translocase subunit SecG
MDNNTASQNPNPQEKKVTKVVYKKKRSIVNILASTVFILALLLLGLSIIFVAAWLHTYKVFTQEKIVAEVTISELYEDEDGTPSFTVTYEPYDDVSGWWGIFGVDADSSDESFEIELEGDQVFFRSDLIRWSDPLTLINFKPVYKVYEVRSDFDSLEDRDKYDPSSKETGYKINGGRDDIVKNLQKNSDDYSWFAQGIFITSAGVDVHDEEKKYSLIVTEDALVIEEI